MRRRRRFRWKFVVIALILLGAAAGGAYALQKVRARNVALAFKDQAFQAAERGETENAVKLMQSYMLRFRDDSAAVRDLALLLEKTAKLPGDQIHVLATLEQALVLKPDDVETRKLAVRKALELHKYAMAKGHLQLLAQSAPDDAQIERQLGECEEGAGNYEEALAHYVRAISLDSKQVEAYVREANLLRTRMDQKEKADALMTDLRRADLDSVPALIARARYFRETGRPASAEPDIERAVQLAPKSADVRFLAAQHQIALDHLEAAEEHLRAGLEAHPDHLASIRLLAELRKRNPKAGDGQDLRALVMRTMKLMEDNPRRTADVLSLLIDVDEQAEARKLLAGPKNDWLPSYIRDFLEARLKIAEEDYVRARELLERCRGQLASVQALARVNHLLLGICHRRLGNPDQAATSFRTALDIAPAWAPAQLELAAANVERGQFDEALGLYHRLMPQVPEVRLTVIRLLMQRTTKQAPPFRDWKPIDNLLAEAPEQQRKSVDWRLLRTESLLAQGKEKEAREELENAVLADPKRLATRLALADLALRKNETTKAAEILDAAEKEVGDRVEVRLARANVAARLEGPAATAALTKLAEDVDRFSRLDQARLYAGLYRLSWGVESKLARRMGEKLAELQPTRVDLRFGLLRLALSDNDEAAANALVAKLRVLEGDAGPFWRCGDVAMRLQFAKPGDDAWIADARTRATEAARARPDWGLPVLLLGELDEKQGNRDSALQHFRSAIELGERSPIIVRRAVQLLQNERRFEEAQDLLRKLAGQLLLDTELSKLALPSLVGREPPEVILDKARRLAPESSRDYRDHLWMGQLQAALASKPAETERAFRRAVELAPTAGETWVGLVFFLMAAGQKQKAEAATAQAETNLTTPEAQPGLALCLEAIGQKDKAEKKLVDAASKLPEDAAIQRGLASLYLRTGDLNKAEPILKRLSEGSSAGAGWARRQQAMLLVQTGSYARIREALPLIEQNLSAANATPEDQRAKAILLALQPQHRAEAIQALESSFKVMPATADEQVLLARLLETARNWPAARERLLAVASGNPAPQHLDFFVNRLLVHDDLVGAQQWVDRLEKLDPDSVRTAAAKARVLVRFDKQQDAKDLLRNLVLAAPDPELLLPLGRLMEDIGLFDAAEQAYRRYGQRVQPKTGVAARLPLARFFGLRGRIEDALKIIAEVGAAARPDAVYSVVSAVVRWPKLDQDQSSRLEAWVKSAQQKSPEAVPLFLAMAEIFEQRDKAGEALLLYERALAKEPASLPALNNSAVLLALTNRGNEAMPRANKAIDLAGPLPPLLDTRGLAHLAAGNAAAAVADLEEAIALEDSALRRFHLALAHKAAGNDQGYADNLQKAKEHNLAEGSLHPLERARWRETD